MDSTVRNVGERIRMQFSFYNISKQQTNIIKGVAIMFIVFHNFLHVTHSIGENQVFFLPNRIYDLFEAIVANPQFILSGTVSYWGFLGVQLFVFISGYGLAKSYSKNDAVSYRDYIVPRLTKLYSLILFGLVVSFILFNFIFGKLDIITSAKDFVLFTIGLPFKNYSLSTTYRSAGAWWYFTLAIQLYFLFPVLYHLIKKYREKAFWILFIISYVLMFILYSLLSADNKFIVFVNFTGYLPEFLLGIALAMFLNFKVTLKALLLAIVVFVLGNFFEYAYPFTFCAATIILLCLLRPLNRYAESSNIFIKGLLFIGGISMYMFVFNSQISRLLNPLVKDQSPLIAFAGAFLSFLVCILFSFLMSLLHKYITKLITHKI